MDQEWFPCPMCLSTLIPGAAYAVKREEGTGKVWDLGATPPTLVQCTRCEGSGRLRDLRQRTDRREGMDRRTRVTRGSMRSA
jgi:RNase P subunit RPR2